jgi:hypothetical protein
MFEKVRELFRRPATTEDVEPDPNVARTRESGGDRHDDRDRATTTGTGTSEGFVGRVSGPDMGEDGESGAEARAR